MKRYLTFFAVMFLASFVITGCGEPSAVGPNSISIVKGGGQFPECLVGVWKSDNYGWAFKFEADGTINKLRHMLALHVTLDEDEGKIGMQGPEEGTFALFLMGDCTTIYEPDTRILEVTVLLEYYELILPHGVLEGGCVDTFTGQVSQDCKTWNVQWRPDSWLKGADPPDPELLKLNLEPLVFTKLDLKAKE